MSAPRTYMAASVPRFIRTARLSHLPLNTIIGYWFTKAADNSHYVFDVIMLPALEFLRTKSYLAVPDTASPSLQAGKFAPPYIPKDVKEVTVPSDEADPESFARAHFIKEFGEKIIVATSKPR
ncbi:MAG TPA: hypothetical protein VMV79_07515 [Alphaproteobacteria bacterium]|nr:hypothetical protein [Alphaproteobacteria bacterium]